MFRWFKRHPKTSILLADAALILLCIPLRITVEMLLSHTDNVCDWTLLGGQCLTCGGTHFVKELLSFHFIEAFRQNEWLFVITVYLTVSLVLVNLMLLFQWRFAEKALKCMYNIPVLIVFLVVTAAFFIIRNIPSFITLSRLAEYLLGQGVGWQALFDMVKERIL